MEDVKRFKKTCNDKILDTIKKLKQAEKEDIIVKPKYLYMNIIVVIL